MHGDLHEMSLVDIIQVTCNEGAEAKLSVQNDTAQVDIFLRHGTIVHACSEAGTGREALFEALRWKDGRFELTKGVPAPTESLTGTWPTLLLEAMEYIDAHDNAMAPGGVSVEPNEAAAGSPAEHLLRRMDGIQGVAGSLLVQPDGTLVAHSAEANVESLAALAVFVTSAGADLRKTFSLAEFERAVLNTPWGRLMVLDRGDVLLGLLLRDQVSPDVVKPLIEEQLP